MVYWMMMMMMVVVALCLLQEQVVMVESTWSTNIVKLRFYMHDTPLNGPTPSAIPVTGFKGASDFPNELKSFLFGQIYVFDDPLTVAASLQSSVFGRAQGTYTYVSREDIVTYVSLTVSVRSGSYAGSSFNVVGAASNTMPVLGYPIVGGTGQFALAQGTVEARVVNVFGPFNVSATTSLDATIFLSGCSN